MGKRGGVRRQLGRRGAVVCDRGGLWTPDVGVGLYSRRIRGRRECQVVTGLCLRKLTTAQGGGWARPGDGEWAPAGRLSCRLGSVWASKLRQADMMEGEGRTQETP